MSPGRARLTARTRLRAAAVGVVGLVLVGWAVARAGNGVAYLAGLVLLVVAVAVAASTVRAHPGWVGAVTAVGLLAAAVGVAVPWAMLRADRGDRGTAVAMGGSVVAEVVDAGDIVLARLITGRLPDELVMVDVAGGAVVHRQTGDHLLAGRGPISAFAFGNLLRDVVALAPDGTERWRLDVAELLGLPGEPDPDESGIPPGPVAVLDDGTLVVASHDGRLLAIDAAGTERWQVELPTGVDVLGGVQGPISSSPARVIAADERGFFDVDGATGELRALDDVVDVALDHAYDYVAVVRRRGVRCTLEIDRAGAEPIELERSCPADAELQLESFDEVIDLRIGEVDETIDARTGGSEPRLSHERTPYSLVFGERSVRALGSDAVIPLGPDALASSSSTSSMIVVQREIGSRNPLRPVRRTAIDIYDAGTGERCAAAIYDGRVSGFGLNGCRALVNARDGSTFILHGETGQPSGR